MNKKKINFRNIAFIIPLIGVLMVWGHNAKIESEHLQRINMAKSNAVMYIKEKYNIDAQAVITEAEEKIQSKQNQKIDWNNPEMKVKMNFQGEEFYVYINSLNKTTSGYDNYQIDEIKQKICDEINKDFPNGQILRLEMGSYIDTSCFYYYNNFFKEYFDGTNLDEVLDNSAGSLDIIFTDVKFKECELFDKLRQWNINTEFVSFESKEIFEEFENLFGQNFIFSESYYALYAPYIKDSVKIRNETITYMDYNTKELDDFSYYYFKKFDDKGFNASVEISDNKYFKDFFKSHNESNFVEKPITNCCRVHSSSGNFYIIYYPIEKLGNIDAENVGAAWISNITGIVNNHNIEKAQVYGRMAVFILPYHAGEFMLVDNSGQGEYIPDYISSRINS